MIKLKDILKEGVNWRKFNSMVQKAVERAYDWEYVENEGQNGVRFDWKRRSMWVHPPADFLGDKVPASVTGKIPPSSSVKRALKKLKVKIK